MKRQLCILVATTISFGILIFILISCTKNPEEPEPTTGNISGRVLDRASATPIVGAQVTTTPVTVSRVTGTDGNYAIDAVQPAQYTVRAVKDGYQENSVVVDVAVGYTATADILLAALTPLLHVQPDVLDFSTATTTLPLTVQNSTGIGTLTWAAGTDQAWMNITPTSGSITTNIQQVTVTVNRTGLPPGNNYGNISFTSNGGSKSIGVVMVVVNPNAPQLSVNLQHLDFDTVTSTRELVISNTGTGTLTWSLVDDQNWISASPVSGNIESGGISTVQVSVDRAGLEENSYSGNVAISSNGGNIGVSVSMRVPSGGTLPAPVLNAPTNIQETSVYLTWNRITSPSFAFFRVYFATHSGVTESDVMATETQDNRYTVTGLMPGTPYYFKVYVYNSVGTGTPSNEVGATTAVPLGTWVSTGVIPGAGSLKDIWPLSDTEVYVLATSGRIYRWNGRAWTEEVVVGGPYASPMQLFFLSPTQGWALYYGSNESILVHYDGTQWRRMTSGTELGSYAASMYAVAENDVWVGAGNGVIYHWNGTAWNNVQLAAGTVSSLAFTDSDNGWAADHGGWNKLFHYDGIGWSLSRQYSYDYSANCKLRSCADGSVWLSYSAGAYVDDSLWIWQGASWALMPSPGPNYYDQRECFEAISAVDAWACILNSSTYRLVHWNGSDWTSFASPVNDAVDVIRMISPSSAWAITSNQVLRYH